MRLLRASGSFTRALSSHIITTKLLQLEMAVKLEAAQSDLSQSVKNTLRTKLTGKSENPAGGFTIHPVHVMISSPRAVAVEVERTPELSLLHSKPRTTTVTSF